MKRILILVTTVIALAMAPADAGPGRFGKIEQMPVETGSVDWVISNCVINLSPDKDQTFGEAHRVLKNGGRLVVPVTHLAIGRGGGLQGTNAGISRKRRTPSNSSSTGWA